MWWYCFHWFGYYADPVPFHVSFLWCMSSVNILSLEFFLLRNLVILHDGACVITGRMGSSSLCVFIYAFRLGATGFIFNKYLRLPFSMSVSHFLRVCWICFWNRFVGSLVRCVSGFLVWMLLLFVPVNPYWLWLLSYFYQPWLLLNYSFVGCLLFGSGYVGTFCVQYGACWLLEFVLPSWPPCIRKCFEFWVPDAWWHFLCQLLVH
jgi:hypothetical protein